MKPLFRYGRCPLNPVRTEHHRCNLSYYVLPVCATMCVQPLHTFINFSPFSSERFRRVGEDRNGSVVVSWPCLLLPHRNTSPSTKHKTGKNITLHPTEAAPEEHTKYKTEGCLAIMMYDHEVGDDSLQNPVLLLLYVFCATKILQVKILKMFLFEISRLIGMFLISSSYLS